MNGLITPKQIFFMDMHGKQSTRRLLARPGTLVLAFLASLLLFFLAGWFVAGQLGGKQPQQATDLALHNQITDLRAKLAESEAAMQLRDNEMQGLMKELEEKRDAIDALQDQLVLYENVMEAGNKVRGVQILRADIEWKDAATLVYDILLVRGGTYRWGAKGHVRIEASDDSGNKARLLLSEDGGRLPYTLETHTSLRGSTAWPHTWRPQRLVVECLDSLDKVVDVKEIVITGDNL